MPRSYVHSTDFVSLCSQHTLVTDAHRRADRAEQVIALRASQDYPTIDDSQAVHSPMPAAVQPPLKPIHSMQLQDVHSTLR